MSAFVWAGISCPIFHSRTRAWSREFETGNGNRVRRTLPTLDDRTVSIEPLCRLQSAVVGCAERRLPVGLIEAEAERAGRTTVTEKAHKVVIARDEAVDVPSNMDVRVEDLGPAWQQLPRLGFGRGQEFFWTLEWSFHRRDDSRQRGPASGRMAAGSAQLALR